MFAKGNTVRKRTMYINEIIVSLSEKSAKNFHQTNNMFHISNDMDCCVKLVKGS